MTYQDIVEKLKPTIRPQDVYDLKDGDEFWYAYNQGGYIDPSDIIEDKEIIEKIEEARKTISAFEEVYNEIVEKLFDADDEEDDEW